MAVYGEIAIVAAFVDFLRDITDDPYKSEQMVGVVVRDEGIVDLRDANARLFELRENAVAATAIDEEVFARHIVRESEASVVAFGHHCGARSEHSYLFHVAVVT